MEKQPPKPWWQPGLTVFAEVTGWLVTPIIIALFLGRYLDEKNNSAPAFFLGLTGVAFIITCVGLVSIAGKYISQMEKENKQKKQAINNKNENRNNNQ